MMFNPVAWRFSDQKDTAGDAPAEGRSKCDGSGAREIPRNPQALIQKDFRFLVAFLGTTTELGGRYPHVRKLFQSRLGRPISQDITCQPVRRLCETIVIRPQCIAAVVLSAGKVQRVRCPQTKVGAKLRGLQVHLLGHGQWGELVE